MTPILKSFLKRLTNLSSRNKSILLLKDSVEQFIDVHQFDFVNGKSSYDIVNQLIADKKTIYICDEIDPRYEKINELSKRLRRIARTEKFIEQERGSEDLYLGYPFVRGKLLDGTVVRCPLLFFPVSLQLEKQKWYIVRRESEPVTFNRSFLLAYSFFNNAKISDEFLEKTFEDFPKESLPFRTALYDFLKGSALIINFNQELFTDSLLHFEKLLKSDLDLSEKNGELKLQSQAVLGIFPQAGSFLVPDYEFLIENSESNHEDLTEYQASSNLSEIFNSKAKILDFNTIKEEKLMAPFAMDASQELAIKKVNAGHSMVIQGPPGTGKSQLICNLVADFAAAGKKVLVVCQKRAALDVVHNRLQTIGFQNFAALIHDFKNDRKQVFNQIADQINLVDEYKKKNQSLDALWLEQDFNQTSREIDRLSQELDDFKTALFDSQECGLSVKNLYLSSNPNALKIDLGETFRLFDQDRKLVFTKQLRVFDEYAQKIKSLGNFWQIRTNFTHFQPNDLATGRKLLSEFPEQSAELIKYFDENFEIRLSWSQIMRLKNNSLTLFEIVQCIDNEELWQLYLKFNATKANRNSLNKLAELQAEVLHIYENGGVETNIPESELSNIYNVVTEAATAHQTGVSALVYNIFSNQKSIVKQALSQNYLLYNAAGLQALKKKIENRQKLHNLLTNNSLVFDFEPIGQIIKKEKVFFESYFSKLIKAKKLLDLIYSQKEIDFKLFDQLSALEVKSKLQSGLNLLQNFLKNESLYEKYFTTKQLNELFEKPVICPKISNDLLTHFEIFVEADQLQGNFSSTELSIISKLYEQETTDVLSLFENSLNLAWISHIEGKYPILRSVSSLKMQQMEQTLQDKITHKQSLSQQILLIKAREHTYKGLEYNRLRNLTTYRELFHQVTKKKKLWSIRQLFSSFSDELFDLVPCWLASPETVSAVFPMESFFDLVIFDEASQCYAEAGLPAIFRGKQVVITGDSKQLQPSDLYAVRFEDETDEQPELEVNSLLDLAIQYLPQTQLNGHYRSQSIDLIDFSNQYFYKNKLQILPHFSQYFNAVPNIKYQKVEGLFENGINQTEAEAVVDLVKTLKRNHLSKSIGIVTFNYRQQNYIQDLLEITPEIFENCEENLFVKNIENVQGDERDIIIFSVGYGPDAKGKVKIQFGSLNQAGGENRLNVAVTRARQQIYLVTSIWPSQLHVDDTLNEGPKLLKKYMEYVQQVSDGNFKPQVTHNEDFKHEKLLKNQLQKADLNLINELPFADLVKLNDQKTAEALILTDDNLFYQSLSSKEAHAYWAINFANKGWAFQKYYSREFWKNQL